MSAFIIFASVYTIINLVYFGVNIFLDMQTSQSQNKSNVESFDVSGMQDEEESARVSEEDFAPIQSHADTQPEVIYLNGEPSNEDSSPAEDQDAKTTFKEEQQAETVKVEDEFSLDSSGLEIYLRDKAAKTNKRNIKPVPLYENN